MTMRQLAEAIGALTSTAREAEPAGRHRRRHHHDHQRGCLRCRPRHADHQPGRVGDHGVRRHPPPAVGGHPADGTETIEPRWVTQLALSFDHRLIDGELGSKFLADVAKVLEDPARGLVWG